MPLDTSTQPQIPIREQLQRWETEHGGPDEETLKAFEDYPSRGDIQNGMSKLSYSSQADEDQGKHERDIDDDVDDEELITVGLFLKPGDVVELSQPGREPVLAVFVRQLDMVSQFFSVNGRWCHTSLNSISFAVTGCVDPDLLQPLLPYMPTNPGEAAPKAPVQVPRELGAPVQAILQHMKEESERIYRTNAPVLDTAFSVLADATRTRMMTLTQIAKVLLARSDPAWTPSPADSLAVRKALNHNEFRFRSDERSHRVTNVFAIRPKIDVEVVETVQEWIREYAEFQALLTNGGEKAGYTRSSGAVYVTDFVNKARRLIAESRRSREPNAGSLGPSRARLPLTSHSSLTRIVWGEPFTDTDRKIINFLQAWVLTSQFRSMPNLHSACTLILHATGRYESGTVVHNEDETGIRMGRATGQLFLQEIGVITPYENRVIYDEQLMLPTVRLSRNLELLNSRAELTRRSPDFRDSMAGLRRDWGSTTVYCIDDAGAQEIDDGVSVERIAGKKDEYWVHVHVANPTAFFDKTHVLSGLAAHMTETVYTPERTFPMLPVWASRNYFSIDRNRPVITFSSRVDAAGNVVETKIQHGIVRNVQSLTPAEVSNHLGETMHKQTFKLAVGTSSGPSHKRRPLPRLSPLQLRELQDLYAVAKTLWKARREAGVVQLNNAAQSVRVFESSLQTGLNWLPPSVDRARVIQGDPAIEVTGIGYKSIIRQEISASNIVEELMLLACRSAALWCSERNIPVMFRGTVEPPSQIMPLEQFRNSVVFPHLEKHGTMSHGMAFRYLGAMGRAIAHTSPLPHKIIGASAYVKVTSPLRRFSDMIAHWQIEAALRYEARTGMKFNSTLVADATRAILPFSQRQMQESIVTLSPRERLIASTKRQADQFWIVQAFMRAFYYQEARLPNTFAVWVRLPQNLQTEAIGFIDGLNTKVTLNVTPGLTYQIGDQWRVAIQSIDVFKRRIYVQPVELLHRDDDLVER